MVNIKRFNIKNSDYSISSQRIIAQDVNEYSDSFSISDSNGYAIVEFNNGHIRTRNFNSADMYNEKLPSYWEDYIITKKNIITSTELSTSAHGVSFFFITDMHWNNNAKLSPKIIKRIKEFTNIKDTIFGGDVIVDHGTKDSKLIEIQDWKNAMKDLNTIYLVGNHDYNTSDQPQSTWENNRISPDTIYRICNSDMENNITYTVSDNVDAGKYKECFGYKDNISQKTRYIFLDSSCVHIPNWRDLNLRLSQYQIDWMKERINELSSGWSVVIFVHIFFTTYNGSIVKHGIGEQIETAIDSIYDTCAATIICIISGHIHAQYSYISSKGYPVLTTTTDAYKENSYNNIKRIPGTISEQAFDIYYIDFSERTIKVISIGVADSDNIKSYNY